MAIGRRMRNRDVELLDVGTVGTCEQELLGDEVGSQWWSHSRYLLSLSMVGGLIGVVGSG